MMVAGYFVDVTMSNEVAIFCRKFCFCNLFYQRLCSSSISYQIRDGCYCELMFFCKLKKFSSSHHCTVLTHYFAAKSAFFKTCYLHEVDGSLGMTITFEYAAFTCFEREHVTRTTEVFWFRVVFNEFHRSNGTFHC